MWSRRAVLLGGSAAALAATTGCSEKVTKALGFAQRMIEIQKRHGGRVGVSALTGTTGGAVETNGSLSIQSTERFAMCSTFKWVLAAAILLRVEQGKLKLDQAVKYSKADMLDYAPVTKDNRAKGQMSIGDLCAAAITVSDNTAANLLLPLIGGPSGLTTFVRGAGDSITRFDRNEPSLNTNIDKDERDTTTPEAMSGLLRTLFTGTVLKPDSIAQLKAWMVATTTGASRIRAGIPAGAVLGHKTGTGENGATNDVGVVWVPDKPPVFLSIYTTGGTLDEAGRDQTIADITRLVFDTLNFVETLDDETSSASSS